MDIDNAASSSSSSSSSIASVQAKLPASAPAALHAALDTLSETAGKKLWHQLTNQLQAVLADPASTPIQIDLYDSFVKGLSKKLDQRRLVEIATVVAGQYEGEQQSCLLLVSLFCVLHSPSGHQDSHDGQWQRRVIRHLWAICIGKQIRQAR